MEPKNYRKGYSIERGRARKVKVSYDVTEVVQ